MAGVSVVRGGFRKKSNVVTEPNWGEDGEQAAGMSPGYGQALGVGVFSHPMRVSTSAGNGGGGKVSPRKARWVDGRLEKSDPAKRKTRNPIDPAACNTPPRGDQKRIPTAMPAWLFARGDLLGERVDTGRRESCPPHNGASSRSGRESSRRQRDEMGERNGSEEKGKRRIDGRWEKTENVRFDRVRGKLLRPCMIQASAQVKCPNRIRNRE